MDEEKLENLVNEKVEEKLMQRDSTNFEGVLEEKFSRRGFLKTLGAGAAAGSLALTPASALNLSENDITGAQSIEVGKLTGNNNDPITVENNLKVTGISGRNGNPIDVGDNLVLSGISGADDNSITVDNNLVLPGISGLNGNPVTVSGVLEVGGLSGVNGDPISSPNIMIEDLKTNMGSGKVPIANTSNEIIFTDSLDLSSLTISTDLDLNQNDGKLILPVGPDAGL